jgi:hypothetical protein
MFGLMVKKMFLNELILVNSGLNVKWFMFRYIYAKVSWIIKQFCAPEIKQQLSIHNLQIILIKKKDLQIISAD